MSNKLNIQKFKDKIEFCYKKLHKSLPKDIHMEVFYNLHSKLIIKQNKSKFKCFIKKKATLRYWTIECKTFKKTSIEKILILSLKNEKGLEKAKISYKKYCKLSCNNI